MPLYWAVSIAAKPCLEGGVADGNPWSFAWAMAKTFADEAVADPARVLLCARPAGEEWFVQAILVCYLFYPLLERLMLGAPEQEPPTRRWLLAIVAVALAAKGAVIAVAFCLRPRFTNGNWYELAVPLLGAVRFYSFPLFRLPDFALGAVVPHLACSSAPRALCACSDALFLAVVALAAWRPSDATLTMITDLQVQGPLYAFALWGFCFAGPPSFLGRLLGLCYPAWLVKTSYGFYLLHLPVAEALGFSWSDPATKIPSHCATFFAATILLAWAAAVLVEDSVERWVRAYLR